MGSLLQTQIAELVGGPHWTSLKHGLTLALSPPSSRKTFLLALQVHARLLLCPSHYAVKEAYANLIETVLAWYSDPRILPLLPCSAIKEEETMHANLVALLSLLCAHCRELPRLWVRYPHTYVQEMVDAMVDLLSWSQKSTSLGDEAEEDESGGNRVLSPADIIAVLDPETKWLKEWFHSFLSRSVLLDKLATQPDYLASVMHSLTKQLENIQSLEWRQNLSDVTSGPLNISRKSQAVAVFSFNLRLVSALLSLRSGHRLVPRASSFLSSLTGMVCMKLEPELGSLVADCLRAILGSAGSNAFPAEVNMLVDNLCQASTPGLDLAREANIINCLPISRLSPEYQLRLIESMAILLETAALPASILSTLLVAVDSLLLSSLQVKASTRLTELLVLALQASAVGSAGLGSRDIIILEKIIHRVPSSILDGMQVSLEKLGLATSLGQKLTSLWELVSRETEQGRPGFADFELQVSRQLGRVAEHVMGPAAVCVSTSLASVLRLNDVSLFDNELYGNCVLRLLICATTSLHLRTSLKQLGVDRLLEDEMKACFTDDDYIMDEKYFLLKYLLLRMEGLAGPSEKLLPCLQNPLQEFRPGRREQAIKGGPGACRQLVDLSQWLNKPAVCYDLGWIEETKVRVKAVLDNTSVPLQQSQVSGVLRGVVASAGQRTSPPPSSQHQSIPGNLSQVNYRR